MVALDWTMLMALDAQSMEEDTVEDMYSVLADVSVFCCIFYA